MSARLVIGGLAVVAVLVALGVFAYRRDRARVAALQAFATSNGWRFAGAEPGWEDRFDGAPFGTGQRRRARNVLQGQHRGREMVAFEYSYQTTQNNGESTTTTTHRFHVAALALPATVPRLEISPEGFGGRLATALGVQDVELESEDFNRAFRVKGDRKFAYDVLHARTMADLLTRPALHLRLQGADALSWDQGNLGPSDLLARLATLEVLLDGVPAYVWSDLKGPRP